MKSSNYEVIVLEADENMWLTQVADVAPVERVFSKKVFLAVNDTPANWHEVDDAYKAEIEALIEDAESEV